MSQGMAKDGHKGRRGEKMTHFKREEKVESVCGESPVEPAPGKRS